MFTGRDRGPTHLVFLLTRGWPWGQRSGDWAHPRPIITFAPAKLFPGSSVGRSHRRKGGDAPRCWAFYFARRKLGLKKYVRTSWTIYRSASC